MRLHVMRLRITEGSGNEYKDYLNSIVTMMKKLKGLRKHLLLPKRITSKALVNKLDYLSITCRFLFRMVKMKLHGNHYERDNCWVAKQRLDLLLQVRT